MSEAAQAQAAEDQPPLPLEGANDDARQRSLKGDLRDLAAEARALAEAELAYQKARAGYAGRATRGIALLAVAAFVVVLYALIAAVVGALIALTPAVGPWAATGLVAGMLLFIAIALALMALSRLGAMKRLLRDDDSGRDTP